MIVGPYFLCQPSGSSEDATAVAPQSDPPAHRAEQPPLAVQAFRPLFQANVIAHSAQEYETAGDYHDGPSGEMVIRVSAVGNEKMETLVAIHELVEFTLCRAAGVRAEETSQYDVLYERARIERPADGHSSADAELSARFGCNCEIDRWSEPGDDTHAPYYYEHQMATSVERMMAAAMGVSWPEYEKTIYALSQ